MEVCIDLLGFNQSHTVLLPAFVPEGVISAFRKKKINIGFYKCKENLIVDIEDLKNKIKLDNNVKSVVIIHYFGFPQPSESIHQLCKEYEIILFEDCAHALFSKNKQGILLGSEGDISFYSFPKSLPVPDGSLFFFNDDTYNYVKSVSINYNMSIFHVLSVAFHFIYLLIKNYQLKMKYSFFYKAIDLISKIIYAGYYQFLKIMKKPVRISGTTKRILGNIKYNRIIDRRRFNASYFYSNIDKKKYHLVFPKYDKNYVLIGIPVLAEDRDFIINQLRKRGIECLKYVKYWNFIPCGKKKEFINEVNFFNKHFLFPISENISEAGIKFIVEVMNNM